jgi:lipid-A-disaccharide synthase
VKFFVIAGEASGDMHGANLIRAIRHLSPQSEFEGFGGQGLKAAGMNILRPLEKLNFMGFVEVVKNLGTVRENFKLCKSALEQNRPDAIILIDYPGFNLRIAKWAKKNRIRVFYYISPQVWAWKENRVKQMKRNIDRLMVILPFEKEFFAKHGMEVDFVGHPLIDEIEQRRQKGSIGKENIIALLPGSREQEIMHILPEMLKVQKHFPDYHFVIGKAQGRTTAFYQTRFDLGNAKIWDEGTYKLLSRSKAALVGSGTATLETALLQVPQVVCYKGNGVSVRLARALIKVPYISLVNLILDRPAVKELIQADLNPNSIVSELKNLLENEDAISKMQLDHKELWDKLGGTGASETAAKLIVSDLKKR